MDFGIKIPLLKDKSFPYWRLSGVYLSNCLVLGALLPFWGLYLQSLGITESQIGISSALMLSANIVAPLLWVKFSHNNHISLAIKMGVGSAFVISTFLFNTEHFWTISALIFFICLSWQGIHPLVESLTLSHLSHRSKYYGQVRLWGSLGFVVSVSVFGLVFDHIAISYFPYILTAMLFTMGACVSFIPAPKQQADIPSKIAKSGAKIPRRSLLMFIGIFLLQISEGAYIGFYSLYLNKFDHSTFAIGNLWAIAVAAEVLMFIVVYKFISHFGAGKLLVLSYLITSLRWTLIAVYPQLLAILVFAQLLHAFTYSAAHSSILELIKSTFGSVAQSKGILIYSGFSIGGGMALGALISGFAWEANANIFALSAILALLAALLICYWLKREPSIH